METETTTQAAKARKRYESFAAISTKPELDRITNLSAQAKRRLELGETIADLSADEWSAFQVMQPGKADRLHFNHRKAMEQAPITKAAPSVMEKSPEVPNPDQPVTQAQLHDILMEVGAITRESIKARLKALEDKLDARVSAIEARPLPKWCGVWAPKQYRESELVTRGGGLWLAMKNTDATPGDNSGAWRLIVKKGGYDE